MNDLKILSGSSIFCDIGTDVNAKDVSGKNLHTGDIVLIYSGQYVGTDLEFWCPCGGLTAVVSDQYQSFTDGSVEAKYGDIEYYVMGIKDCKFNHPNWQIHLVKKFSDVVDGEHWSEYGFNYKNMNFEVIIK